MEHDFFDGFTHFGIEFTEGAYPSSVLNWTPACEDFIHDEAKAVDIGPRIDTTAIHLFRSHVFESARLWRQKFERERPPVQLFRNAEVDKVRSPVVGDDDVAWLEIAMHDLVTVHVFQDVAQPTCQLKNPTYGRRTHPFENVVERLSFDVCQNQVWAAFHRHRNAFHDSGMVEFGQYGCFLRQSRAACWIGEDVCLRDLYYNCAAGFTVERLEDSRHPSVFNTSGNLKASVQKLTDIDVAVHAVSTLRGEALRSR